MSILKSSVVVAGWTFFSRIFGFIRDLIIAAKLGTSAASDAFFIALIIPNLLRRVFAEGAFNVAFVPLFAKTHEEGGKKAAEEFSSVALTILMAILLIVTILVELFMPEFISYIIAPGTASNAEAFELTVLLSRITFPYLMLITFASLAGSICNTLGKFAAFAAVPVLLNISIITCLFIFPTLGVEASKAAAISIPIGGMMQVIFMAWALKKYDFKLHFKWPARHKNIKPLLLRMGPAALGVGVLQISFLIDMHLASYLGESAISYLNYANRFYQLPLALIGIALATVLLPHFSRALKKDDKTEANKAFSMSLTYGITLAGASTVGLFLLAEPLMVTFFQHGEFTAESSRMSAYAMMAFCVGIPAFIVTKVTITAFYANEDTKTPLKISVMSLAVNVIGNLILMQYYGHIGLAMATAISGWFNAGAQMFFLHRHKFIAIDDTPTFYTSIGKTLLMCIMMVITLVLFKTFVPIGDIFWQKLLWLVGAVATGALTFVLIAQKSKLIDIRLFIDKMKKST